MPKPKWNRALVSIASALAFAGQPLGQSASLAQESSRALAVPAGLQDSSAFQSAPIQYLPFAHFAIPFEIDRAGKLPQEVHLWVSADLGKTWLPYASNSPDKRSFEFQAAAEGEYLFAVQTRDERGISALAAAPPMRILVDTTRPQVQLSADINAAGRLVIDYRIDERYLAEDSVQLSYAIDGRTEWEAIRVGRLSREGNLWSGRIEQEMPRCHEIQLKLIASDLAQNSAETIARYNAPRTASAANGMQLASQRAQTRPPTLGQLESPASRAATITPQLSGPRAAAVKMNQLAGAATGPHPSQLESAPGSVAWEPTSRSPATTAGNPRPAFGHADATTTTSRKSLGQTVSSQAETQAERAQSTVTLPLPDPAISERQQGDVEELPTPLPTESSGPFIAGESADPGLPTTLRASGDLELSSGSPAPYVPPSPALSSVLDRVERSSAPPRATVPSSNVPTATVPTESSARVEVESTARTWSSSPAPANRSTTPESTHQVQSSGSAAQQAVESSAQATFPNDAFHCRSRSFSLDYSVESLRGLPIADIELWGTDDRGNTWLKWGNDPDRESPFDVQVGDDGLYGFRMVIIGQNGLVSNRPSDGDPADMWINVDTKFPSIKITRALYGEGPDAGMLVIDYTCDDENLHDRPISLAYSERPTGPWSTITTGLKNTGIYLWRADPNLPQHVYLRIQAVDRAGNVQEHRLDLPINLRGLTPRGRIQGFRPIDPK